MPLLDVLNFLKTGNYPSARAGSPSSGLNLLMNGVGGPVPGTSSSTTQPKPSNIGDLGKLLGVMPGFTPYNVPAGQGIQQLLTAGLPAAPNTPAKPPSGGDKSKKGAANALASLLAQAGAGGGNQPNPVVAEIQRQIGMLQNQAGASKSDLLKHEQMAKSDLMNLYGHLGNYIANQRQQNNSDFKQSMGATRRLFNSGVRAVKQGYRQAQRQSQAEDARLGISGDVGVAGMRADQRNQAARLSGDRADLQADMRSQRGNWNALSRQMQSDAKLERNVQVGQVHRDTTKALADLSNTLQTQLGQLRMARAQAQASGAGNPLDVLSKELDIKKKLIDIKAAQKKLAGGTPTSGSASKGFQAALQYLGTVGGKMGPAEQNLLNTAQLQLSVPHSAGGGTPLPDYSVMGPNGHKIPDYWDSSNIAGLMAWMAQKIGTPGGNSGMGPATPTELAQLQRALRMAFGQD